MLGAHHREHAEDLTGALRSSTFCALGRLEAADINHPLTARRRTKVWGFTAVINELDHVNKRIVRRVHPLRSADHRLNGHAL